MSKFSKALKKAEKKVSTFATKIGVGSDVKKFANAFGAANVGGAVGAVTGFLGGGASGAIYGAVAGGATAGYQKLKGAKSSKFIANSAGMGAIAGTVGPLIYKPGTTALITAPGPVSGYANASGQIAVKTSSGGLLGTTSAVSNVFTDALGNIGKSGIFQYATDSLRKIFAGGSNADYENPDYLEGNAVPPGGTFPSWLKDILPGKSSDPTEINVSSGGGTSAGTEALASPFSNPLLIAGALLIGGFFFLKKRA